MNNVIIRSANGNDAEQLLEIYGYYVRNTAITFEYEVPSLQEFEQRIVKTLQKYPYLVLEQEGKILGYAYAGPLKERAAYGWSSEVTIYLEETARKCGYGRMLYEALEKEMKNRGFLNLYACIADPETEDEYLTKNSVQFHEHLGYKMVGKFSNCGYKFERWYHMVWMEKIIGEHKKIVSPVK